jgi:hypothetical protein
MIEIKNLEGIVTRLYSFETEEEYIKQDAELWFINKILFSGTKSELREKPNEWWEGVVETRVYPKWKAYVNYSFDGQRNVLCLTAKESGLSLIESVKEEFIIITEEKI